MKNRVTLPLVVAVGLLLSVLWIVPRGGSAAQDDGKHWEHLALSVDAGNGIGDAETSRRIVQFGNDGWELVSVESLVKDGTTTKLAFFFKRPK